MLLVLTSSALNPRMLLVGSSSIRMLVAAAGNQVALTPSRPPRRATTSSTTSGESFPAGRRPYPARPCLAIRKPPCQRHRSGNGGRAAPACPRRQGPVAGDAHVHRAMLRAPGLTLPTKEHMLVVAPAGVDAKQRLGFEATWRDLPDCDPVQRALFYIVS